MFGDSVWLRVAAVLMTASSLAHAGSRDVVQGKLSLSGAVLTYSAPRSVRAYEKAVVKYELAGQGDACVQAIATNNPAHERYFDTTIPHDFSAKVEYLSDDDKIARFKISNVGDTIWKAAGYGTVTLLNAAEGQFLPGDIAPGDSFEKELRISEISPDEGSDVRVVGFILQYGDSYGSLRSETVVRTAFAKSEVGKSRIASEGYRTYPHHPALDEFGGAFVWKNNRGKNSGSLVVEIPPWADRLVISLVREGARKAAVIPISPSEDGLRIARAPNKRWTLNGKPIVLVDTGGGKIANARKQFGGDNVVILNGVDNYPRNDPNPELLQEIRDSGLKCFPVSLCYVRLQWLGRWAGVDLMPGRINNENERVDALDPNFARVYADYVDYVIKTAGDVLYRTADGKLPLGLCDEAQYGYPWAFGYPTRWGGQTPQDVAAFRVWLKEKYGTVEKLNARWKTDYMSFEAIDPSPICEMIPREYPDPWKEWGPAIEDFDRFRSKILNNMWRKTFAEIKRRHPEVLLGLNFYTDFASDTECIYNGFWKWGTGINWSARRTAVLPEDLDYLDFVTCWNTGSPEAARANIEYWKKKGVDVIVFARGYGKVELNDHDEFYLPQIDSGGLGGLIIDGMNTSYFATMRATVEAGGIPALFSDYTLCASIDQQVVRETVLLNQELAKLAGK